jgi:hypothetical protein
MAITTRGLAKLASIRAYDHTPHATAATAAKTARGAIPPVRRYTLSDASMTVSDNTTPVVLDPKTKSGRTRAEIEQSLKRLDRIALLMDDQFEIPIIKKRIGLDPIIGLIPGGGDWVVWFVSVYVFWEAARLGAPLPLLVRMASNIAVDLLGGYVPGVGDVFDAFFKANRRNVELLRGHFGAREELGAPLPAVLPERALANPNPVTRYAVGVGLTLGLLVIASGPIALLYWLMSGG